MQKRAPLREQGSTHRKRQHPEYLVLKPSDHLMLKWRLDLLVDLR